MVEQQGGVWLRLLGRRHRTSLPASLAAVLWLVGEAGLLRLVAVVVVRAALDGGQVCPAVAVVVGVGVGPDLALLGTPRRGLLLVGEAVLEGPSLRAPLLLLLLLLLHPRALLGEVTVVPPAAHIVMLLLLLLVVLLLLVMLVVGVVAGALGGWRGLAGGPRAAAGLLDGAQTPFPGAVRRGVTPGGEGERESEGRGS